MNTTVDARSNPAPAPGMAAGHAGQTHTAPQKQVSIGMDLVMRISRLQAATQFVAAAAFALDGSRTRDELGNTTYVLELCAEEGTRICNDIDALI